MKHSREEREQRRRLHEEMNKTPPPLIETDDNIIRKLLSKQAYTSEDMRKCVKGLLEDYSEEFTKQFAFIESPERFDEVFEELETALYRPYLFIYSKCEYYYILLCLFKTRNRVCNILYKDPFSNSVDERVKLKFNARFEKVEFVLHRQEQKDYNEDKEALCGPICLRNMKILLDCLRMYTKNVVENFRQLEFCNPADINRDRFSRVMVLTSHIAKNTAFLVVLREFINKLPSDFVSNQQNEEYDEYESSIQKEYPTEMEDVHILLQIISDTVTGLEILKMLKNICDILGLNYGKIHSLFPGQKTETENETETNSLGDAQNKSSFSSNFPSLNSSLELKNSNTVVQKPSNQEENVSEAINNIDNNAEGDASFNGPVQLVSLEEKEIVSELQCESR